MGNCCLNESHVETSQEGVVFKGDNNKFVSKVELINEIRKLNYTMINIEETATKLIENPGLEYKKLKTFHKKVLEQGRTALIDGKFEDSNKHFALAYQCRCVCDWIYVDILGHTGKDGKAGHANFLHKERIFGQLASALMQNKREPLTKKEISLINSSIKNIAKYDMVKKVTK